jgi:NhaA family Na+:H+ antiporter
LVVTRFVRTESASGVVLVVAAVVALVWANSPWQAGYEALWHTTVTVGIGSFGIEEDLRHVVNDALMAVFFFVVGLEIKREVVRGELSDPRVAALPALAALGGMLVPAALYTLVAQGTVAAHGWGIPMATDIAFAIGVLALLGDRIPSGLKVLLLGLAIVDDIGAILVIAVFYTEQLELRWLAGAAGGLVLVAVLRRVRVWYAPVYALVGIGVWLCTLESGVHATIAGVALGLLTPARPLLPTAEADRVAGQLSHDSDVTAEEIRAVEAELRASVSVAQRLQEALHPWTSYVIIPLFALANAGIELSGEALGDAATSRVTIGVVVGLVVGKLVGVSAAAWLAVRLGIARLPAEVSWRHVVGMAGLAGIGFTVSIFVTGLAYDEGTAALDQAKVGVLVASAVAAVAGTVLLRRSDTPA